MTKRIKKIIILTVGLFLIFSINIVSAAEGDNNYSKEYKDNIYHMAKIMRCIPKTGDVNLDYLYEAALFCEGESSFSEAYIKFSTNAEIENIAKGYIERENAAVENIKTVIEKLKDNPEKDEAKEEKYLNVYNEILNEMVCKFQKIELTENIDMDFLKFIVIHHEGVIKLTEEFSKISNNGEVEEVANKLSDQMNNDIKIIGKYI